MRIPRPAVACLALVVACSGPRPSDPAREREAALEACLVRMAADSLGVSLLPDAALRDAARELALVTACGFEGDVQEALRQATSDRGAIDPVPFLVYGTTAEAWPAAIVARFRTGLASMPPRERRLCTHVAAGVVARRTRHALVFSRRRWSVLLLVSQRALTYRRFPAAPQPGDRFLFEGEVFPPFRDPEVLLTDPGGRVHPLDNLSPERTTFRTYVHLGAGPGEYQLEVMGRDDMGPRVLGLGALHARASGAPTPHAQLVAVAERGESLAGPHPLRSAPAPLAADQEEARLVALVNRDRRRAGVAPLCVDPQLATLARAHSHDMLDNRFFAHVSPRSGPLGARAAAAGITCSRIAENIALHRDVEGAEAALLRSPGHRANILDPEFTHLGIGVAIVHEADGTPRVYVTQNFAVRAAALSEAQVP